MTKTEFTNQEFEKLFSKTGAFFAFSNEQLAEKSQKGITYVNMGAGLICPKENAKELQEGFSRISAEAVAIDKANNTPEKIILRELCNYECFYVGDPTEAIEALEDYGFTKDEILKVYWANFDRYQD